MPAHFVDAAGPYILPTGWNEVLTHQYLEADRMGLATMEARASFFAGRPIQVNGLVADTLAFMLSEPPTAGGLAYPLDLGQETYLQVESIRALVAKPLHESYTLIYAAFKGRYDKWGAQEFDQAWSYAFAERCKEFTVADTYPAVHHALTELQRLNTKYAELADPDRTEAGRRAKEAGASMLDMFSHFDVALHYAQRYGKTVDEVYQWPWETVALMLLHDRRTAIVHDNLNKPTT